jgi:hypothetical protein
VAPKAGIVPAMVPSRRGQLAAARALMDFLSAKCVALDREEAKRFKSVGES